jgi:hypothetical protein
VIPEVAEARAGIRGVDWANRSYGRRMKLKNGRYTYRRYHMRRDRQAMGCLHTSERARLKKVRYGDLTGDGRTDALVEISWSKDYCKNRYGGRVLVAFKYRSGRAVELARVDLTEVTAVRVVKGRIHVQRRVARKGKWLKCASQWRLKGKTIKRIRQRCKP